MFFSYKLTIVLERLKSVFVIWSYFIYRQYDWSKLLLFRENEKLSQTLW